MRTPPSWFKITHYEYLTTCTPSQWYLEISARRELKALYELRRAEPKLFIKSHNQVNDNNLAFYEHFFTELANKREQVLVDSHDNIPVQQMPPNVQRYVDFKIIPLFDLLHWYERNNEPTPSHEELKNWLFPTTEKHVRYIVGDAKKNAKSRLT